MKLTSFAYLAVAVFYIGFMELLPAYLGAGIKALPVFILMIVAMLRLTGAWRIGLLLALLFSAAGDVLLAFNGIYGDLFIAGLGSFLIAQLVYAGLFWTHRSSDTRRARFAVFSFVIMAVAGMIIVPYAGEIKAPVMAYILAIGTMLMGAAVCNRPVNRLFAGALLFVISDLIIAVNQFIWVIPWSDVLIMTTYYGAQYLLVVGALSKAVIDHGTFCSW